MFSLIFSRAEPCRSVQSIEGPVNSIIHDELRAGGDIRRIVPWAAVTATTFTTAFLGPLYWSAPPPALKSMFAKLRLRKSTLGTWVIFDGTGIVGEIAIVKAAGVMIDAVGINL
jgi:hypothetical protein